MGESIFGKRPAQRAGTHAAQIDQAPTPGRSTLVMKESANVGLTAPRRDLTYAVTFDPNNVRLPWTASGAAGAERDEHETQHGAKALPRISLDLGEVKVGVVDLGSGEPRHQILEAVAQMADAWNLMVTNLTGAVQRLIEMVGHDSLKKAPDGFILKLWSRAEKLLTRAATFVTGGSPLGATVGLAAIKRILDHGEKLEETRLRADHATFIRALSDKAQSVKVAGVREGGNLYINQAVSRLDREFLEIGKQNPDDAWKRGDNGIVGAQAVFLKQLLKASEKYVANTPSQNDFEIEFLVEWVNAHHQTRKRSPLRSPFDESTYQDGYIAVELTLSHSELAGWGFHHQNEATLHCPQSPAVAARILETRDLAALDTLGIPIHFNIHTNDRAWKNIPTAWKNERTRQVRLNAGRMVVSSTTKPFWDWVLDRTGMSTELIFKSIHKLKG